MTNKTIYRSLGYLDPELIMKAAPAEKVKKKKKHTLIKWASLAACLAIIIMVGALMIPHLSGNPISFGGVDRYYKGVISGSEKGYVFPWEYMTVYEKYGWVRYDGKEYCTRARAIDEALLGDVLGGCTAMGYDIYTNKDYTAEFEVRKIKGVSEDYLIAIAMEGKYYVYLNSHDSEKQPATLGELLDIYHLAETLSLAKFSVNEGFKTKGYFEIADDLYIWQVLSQCRDAKPYVDADKWSRGDRVHLSFTATSEALGIYKKVFNITEDGYLSTNVLEFQYVYNIGKEAANRIITYAKNNAIEKEFEPYEYTIAGTLTEIGDGYILIDDSILCVDPDDGMVFKILTEDFVIRRYFQCGRFSIGDTVAVKFQSDIVLGEENTVSGAISMYEGTITDAGFAVLE